MMGAAKNKIHFLKRISVLIACLQIFISCQFSRFIFYNFADIHDYKKFPERKLKASQQPFIFPVAGKAKFPKKITNRKYKELSLEKFLEKNKTVAFLIIHK